jgi:hypothetical protein
LRPYLESVPNRTLGTPLCGCAKRNIAGFATRNDAWEVKEKREARPVFEIMEWKIGGGFYVKATLPNSAPENVTGFVTKNDAIRWVRNDSAAWLHTHQHVIEKKKIGK